MTAELSERHLEELEAVIDKGKKTFIEVGEALLEIREGRLYREAGYKSFDTYCRERWGWSARHANRLAIAAETATKVGPMGPTFENEREVRAWLRERNEAHPPPNDLELAQPSRRMGRIPNSEKPPTPERQRAALFSLLGACQGFAALGPQLEVNELSRDILRDVKRELLTATRTVNRLLSEKEE